MSIRQQNNRTYNPYYGNEIAEKWFKENELNRKFIVKKQVFCPTKKRIVKERLYPFPWLKKVLTNQPELIAFMEEGKSVENKKSKNIFETLAK
eukprot:Pgem_evm2s18551